MNSIFAKRALAFAAAAALLFSLGCGQASAEEKATEDTSPEIVAVDGGTSDTAATGGEANASYAGIYHVDATTDESESGSYASSTANENTVLVERMGVLTMTSADINKTGDAEDGFSAGTNAAVAVVSKGQMTLSESNITTNGIGAVGLAVLGEGTQLALNNTSE